MKRLAQLLLVAALAGCSDDQAAFKAAVTRTAQACTVAGASGFTDEELAKMVRAACANAAASAAFLCYYEHPSARGQRSLGPCAELALTAAAAGADPDRLTRAVDPGWWQVTNGWIATRETWVQVALVILVFVAITTGGAVLKDLFRKQ